MSVAVDDFLAAFFGPGNTALPDAHFGHPRGDYVARFVAPLRQGVRRPVILPRQHHNGRTDAYVLCWDAAQAASVRAMLEAFVAHSIVPFDGRVARLRTDDPIDTAVISLVGHDTTFILRPTSQEAQRTLWLTLQVFRDLLDLRPERTQPVPRSPGRLLADFNAALAAGAAATSAELLDEMAMLGGFSPLNLAYLKVHRLARLGRDGELLRLPDLDDVITSRPPRVIAEEVLAAWARHELRTPAAAAPLEALDGSLLPNATRVGSLAFYVDASQASNDALLGAAAIALLGRNTALCGELLAVERLPTTVRDALNAVVPQGVFSPPSLVDSIETPSASSEAGFDEEVTPRVPATWAEWGRLISRDGTALTTIDTIWADWPAPVTEDADLARALNTVGSVGAQLAWSMVGPFIDADEFGLPAWRSAQALLLLAATYDRWAPADLAPVQALLEIFTRGAPPATDYRDVLDLLGGAVHRWASVSTAAPTLDMLDLLVRSACSDLDARLRFSLQALEPLHRHRRRLTPDALWLAQRVSYEIEVNLDWTVSNDDAEVYPEDFGTPAILLYSLDTGVLKRVADALTSLIPGARIYASFSKVGSDQLRAYARGADIIAVATRCAKHAATGFIRQHAGDRAVVVEADGAGSASLLRVALSAIHHGGQ